MKIKIFKQEKKYIVDFIIEFETLVMKTKTDDMHIIFILKKNVKSDIIKTILEYLPIAALESLKKWKVAIISVKLEYEFTENKQDYKTGSETTYEEKKVLIDIRKSKDSYNKDKKSKCFNYNIYKYMTKDYQKLNKEKEARMCYKCDKVRYLAKNYRSGQKIKNKSVQEESNEKDNDKKKGFVRGSE